ncbi:MAG: AAA family ATPase, partial [Bacteroidota bacterium]
MYAACLSRGEAVQQVTGLYDIFTIMYTRSGMYVGTDDFAKLLLESQCFVDKSLFIKEFLEDSGEVALITRPRRWG